MPWKLSVTAFVSGLGSLSKKRENRENDRGLLKCFLLLQSLFPAVCNMGVEKGVANRADTLSEAEQMQGREKGEETSSTEDKIHQRRVKQAQRDQPKGRRV